MNATSLNPKTEFLLGAGLNVLHQESREWLETIAFWKDETRFFADLLQKKELKEKTKSEYGKMLENLDKIHANLFDYLADDIRGHEKLLSKLHTQEKGLADGEYRDKHRNLKERMDIFSNDFKEFKKMVFGYAKKL
ncbi:hypothetical protein GGR42_002714 [Saonia flava]|uniref:Uncharacterized protein n=1 Tax=Saonia flava TaxID=523696 RepID=A0A846R1B7_9FLAO|nr:hypothetical protein [Saonia flava]NJB72223.1 hypothetical protein [Saonia flava]